MWEGRGTSIGIFLDVGGTGFINWCISGCGRDGVYQLVYFWMWEGRGSSIGVFLDVGGTGFINWCISGCWRDGVHQLVYFWMLEAQGSSIGVFLVPKSSFLLYHWPVVLSCVLQEKASMSQLMLHVYLKCFGKTIHFAS